MIQTVEEQNITAVLLVDFQADFIEDQNGSLAVAGTDKAYVEAVVKATQVFAASGIKIFATQDWHPQNHMSFSRNNPDTEPFDVIELNGRSQIMWPVHCVQGTAGAQIMIKDALFEDVVQKGMNSEFDSYSGFADDGDHQTRLNNLLMQEGIKKLIVYGLATDFCVRFTVLDAIKAGFKVQLLSDLCRGVALDSTVEAMAEMRAKSVIISSYDDIRPES